MAIVKATTTHYQECHRALHTTLLNASSQKDTIREWATDDVKRKEDVRR